MDDKSIQTGQRIRKINLNGSGHASPRRQYQVNGSGHASPKFFIPELLILLNEPIDKFILDSLYTNYEIKIKFSIIIKTKDRVEISSLICKFILTEIFLT